MSLTCDTTGSCAIRSKNADSGLEPAVLAGQGGGEVEPEAVDVHLGHPVPQRVHDQPQRQRAARR